MSDRSGFYGRVLHALLADGTLTREMEVLVVAGGAADREAFLDAGFERVTISNVDESGDVYAPYAWLKLDAEDLDLPDDSFDAVVVSAGLHHCASPHRALVEMLRVARRAIFAIESRDSLLMRVAVRAGAAGEYELEAVVAHDFRAGGVRNTAIPNYVYRWTEREVEKTVASYRPWTQHRFRWFREFELHESLLEMRRNRLAAAAVLAMKPFVTAVTRLFPSQGNLFAFVVVKTDELQPWVRSQGEEVVPDVEFMRRRLRG